ncbi:uncharacterized protein LOC131311678 isoform X2 [Rhododendron vialii]|uniref:uncharacterized protein LOC131311678 isoform X2 n=1 Tax=Rhododendron vialii TaxID=182163 RepID=UPI00265D71FD|nr:uncharacterized protein LOC131311678 isoform X2 [Rhododendron vialii]
MEVLKLSRFKLQLQALVTEVRQLRERGHFATEQLTLSNQKQKHTKEEFERKQSELQAELALSNELRQKLGRKVSYLENDNAMLENKQKELKGTIASLLQARESFVKVYEDSTCEMRRSIQARDRKLAILSEKIDAHLSQFDTIEKEAFSVKQVLDYVQHLVSEKEGIVARLKSKMDELSAYEKVFVEKISDLQSKLGNSEHELRRKEKTILLLQAQLEETKISNNCQPQIEELQNTLSTKDEVIQNLQLEKKALQLELRSLGVFLHKIQKAVTQLNDEDRRTFSSVVGGQEECTPVEEKENNRIEDVDQNIEENYPSHDCEGGTAKNAASIGQEHDSVCNPLQGNNNLDSCISEDNCTTLVHHQDSESSTTPSRNP